MLGDAVFCGEEERIGGFVSGIVNVPPEDGIPVGKDAMLGDPGVEGGKADFGDARETEGNWDCEPGGGVGGRIGDV
ncbi:hypothetical protein NUACC21_14480 [Scytonema sp. NUACC21]